MMHEHAVPFPHKGRLFDYTITGRQRGARRDFLLMLGVDPARVPDGAMIDYDETTDEYRLQVINPGGHLVFVRRRLRPPQFGGILMGGRAAAAVLPELAGAIAPSLRQLRDAYAVPVRSDVTIIDDPVRPGGYDPALAAAAAERVGYMRARGA
jgi:hypothetical protein